MIVHARSLFQTTLRGALSNYTACGRQIIALPSGESVGTQPDCKHCIQNVEAMKPGDVARLGRKTRRWKS